MILQMVAEGKISADEAEKLLQAIEETGRAVETAAAETARSERPRTWEDLGEQVERAISESLREIDLLKANGSDLVRTVDRAVSESLRGLEQALEELDERLEQKLGDPVFRRELRSKIGDRMRRHAERAMERARQAEERARRMADRKAERAEREAERARALDDERTIAMGLVAGLAGSGRKFFKVGVSVDKESVHETEQLTIPAQPGDRLVLQNRVGDVTIEFYDGDTITAEVHKTVWGEDQQDARERADATRPRLVRKGPDVVVEVERPSILAVGFMEVRHTRLDYTIRVPHGVHLQVKTTVGDLKIAGDRVGTWDLQTKVGNVDLQVGKEAGFRWSAETTLGEVRVDLQGQRLNQASCSSGTVGDGSGNVTLKSKTGDIHIRN